MRFPQPLLLTLLTLLPSLTRADDLTFLGWSDQHVTPAGDASHLFPAIDAMNAIENTPFPESIGGRVPRPAFVLGLGDATEWPTRAAKNAYHDALAKRLKLPAYDLIGNHDEGGNSPSRTMKDWIISRHGALSYAFDHAGIHFLMVYSEYDESLNNPAQPISPKALAFIRNDLAKLPKNQPVILALHLCHDAITNKDALIDALGQSNVLLILGGHYHKPTLHEYRSHHFLQLPSPQSTTQFTVLHLTPNRLLALTYDYKSKSWLDTPQLSLPLPRP